MTQVQKANHYVFYGTMGNYYEDNLVVNMRRRLLRYTKTLSLLVSLDLSRNNLSGDLPEEITKLSGLMVLNLSRNHVSGHIPGSISKLKQLSSLDLSSNRLSGAIPQSLASLSFLGNLNLSNNEFSGKVPYIDHVTTFDETSFAGNPGLCGAPLVVKCPHNNLDEKWSPGDNSVDGFHSTWFYLIIGLAFTTGVPIPYLVLKRRTWKDAYFSFVDKVVERISWLQHGRTMYQRTRQRP